MLFGRRRPADWREKIRISLWPRRSWSRSAKYVSKRILRLAGSPHAIAAGVAAGVFASFTPFIGFHFMIAFLISYIIAGNLIAAASGTFFGNPISFPFIWASTYTTGNLMLSNSSHVSSKGLVETLRSVKIGNFHEHGFFAIFGQLAAIWNPVIKPMLVGGILIGTGVSVIVYILTRWLVIKFKSARQKRFNTKDEKNSNSHKNVALIRLVKFYKKTVLKVLSLFPDLNNIGVFFK